MHVAMVIIIFPLRNARIRECRLSSEVRFNDEKNRLYLLVRDYKISPALGVSLIAISKCLES